MKRILALTAGLMVSACATATITAKSGFMDIQYNSTKEVVVSLVGNTKNRQFKGKNEAWQYCQKSISSISVSIVWFYDEKVTGVTNSTIHPGGIVVSSCTNFFREINWESAPDRVIEIRER